MCFARFAFILNKKRDIVRGTSHAGARPCHTYHLKIKMSGFDGFACGIQWDMWEHDGQQKHIFTTITGKENFFASFQVKLSMFFCGIFFTIRAIAITSQWVFSLENQLQGKLVGNCCWKKNENCVSQPAKQLSSQRHDNTWLVLDSFLWFRYEIWLLKCIRKCTRYQILTLNFLVNYIRSVSPRRHSLPSNRVCFFWSLDLKTAFLMERTVKRTQRNAYKLMDHYNYRNVFHYYQKHCLPLPRIVWELSCDQTMSMLICL